MKLSQPPGVRQGAKGTRDGGLSAVWVVGPQGMTELLRRAFDRI